MIQNMLILFYIITEIKNKKETLPHRNPMPLLHEYLYKSHLDKEW